MADTDDRKVLKMTLICTLCLQKFNKPRALACYHTFCETCLKNYLVNASGKDKVAEDGIPCPVCKAAIVPPKPGLSVREWAEQFPLNNLIETLIDIVPVSSYLEYCEPCKDNRVSKPARFSCQQCAETLCEECTKCHQTMKATKGHVITPLENSRSSSKLSISTDEVLCNDHKDKELNMYCQGHEQPGCSMCIEANHKKCGQVVQISDALEKEKPAEVEQLLTKMDKLIVDAETVKRERQDMMQSTIAQKTKILQDIGEAKKILMDRIEKIEGQINAKFDSLSTTDFAVMQEQVKYCNSVQSTLQHSKADIKSAQEQKAKKKEFIAVQQGMKQYKDFATELKKIVENSTKTQYLLEEIRQVEETFCALDNLGKQDQTTLQSPKASARSLPQQKPTSADNNQTKTVKNKKSETSGSLETLSKDSAASLYVDEDQSKKAVKKTKTLNAKVRSDKRDCRLTAIRMLSNASMLLADNANAKLKLFGEFGDLQCTFNCAHPPWDFTFVNNEKFVVTFPDERKIRILRLEEKITEIGFVLASKGCYGVCMAGENLAVTISSGCIRIISLDGTVKMMVDTDYIGKRVFSNPEFITFNPIISCLYVSDYNNHTITALHYDDGKVDKTPLFVYPVSGPRGVCVDSKGILYVCGFWSNDIHKVKNTGGMKQVLLDSLARPLCIAFNADGDKLAISEQGNPNMIKVFRIVEASEEDNNM